MLDAVSVYVTVSVAGVTVTVFDVMERVVETEYVPETILRVSSEERALAKAELREMQAECLSDVHVSSQPPDGRINLMLEPESPDSHTAPYGSLQGNTEM